MTVDYETLFVEEPDGSLSPVLRPMLAVRIIGPGGSNPPILGRLDTGADGVLIPELEAGFLGVDLDEASRVPLTTLGSGITAIHAEVDLEIRDPALRWRWSARVAFHDGPQHLYLWGIEGFLEHFAAIFDGRLHRVTLSPNGTFRQPANSAR